MTAATAVTAVGSAFGDEFLTMQMSRTGTAVTALAINLDIIYKVGLQIFLV